MANVVRRTVDLSVSLLGLLLLAVPLALVAVAIKLDSRGPVFFLQERAGKDGKPFLIWKFRTMVVGAVNLGLGYGVTKDDDRITRVGRFLRHTSIDELPQLINVLQGHMALVGPRPTLQYQVDQYTPEQRQRLLVRPGITSWPSVNGRNRLSWEERIDLDVWYVHNRTLWLDFTILLRTLWVAFVVREGVYADDGINREFTGAQHLEVQQVHQGHHVPQIQQQIQAEPAAEAESAAR